MFETMFSPCPLCNGNCVPVRLQVSCNIIKKNSAKIVYFMKTIVGEFVALYKTTLQVKSCKNVVDKCNNAATTNQYFHFGYNV